VNVRGALRTGMAATAAGALIVAMGGPSAQAQTAAGDTVLSQSTARVLSGSIASTSLDTIAEAAATVAKNFGGAPVTKDVTPDVSALNNALTVPLGQLKGSLTSAVPGLSLGGVVDQRVVARQNGSSHGAASTAGLTLDLGTLTGGATDALATLKVGLGALTAQATQQALPDGSTSGSCTIAGLDLDLTSPLLAQLVTQLTAALAPVDNLVTTLETALGNNPLVTIAGLPTIASVVDKLTDIETEDGSVAINLQTGSVHVDLAKLLGTAGLDFCSEPNTKPLAQLGSALADQIPTLLTTTLQSAAESVTNLLRLCTATVTTDCITIKVAGLDVSTQAGTVLNTVTATLGTVLSTVNTSLTTLLGTVGGLLGQLTDALTGVLDLTTNIQSTSGGTFRETALRLDLLSAAGGATSLAASDPLVRLNLATATVGPNAVAPTTTTTTPPPTTPSSTPIIKVDAGRAGPAGDDGGISLLWVGVLLIAGGAGGTFWLRRKAPGHL
jgi:hypothetical protein